VTLDIAPLPRPEWSPLPADGVVGVEGRVLIREADGSFVAMLRFAPHATIHEHPGANDTLVVCIEGEGFTSVGEETAPLRDGERAFWPTGVPHRIWTEDDTMTTLMIERPGVGFPARGLADHAG
jgi:quercetin dioxygenase-like cupin family protein